MLRFPIHLEPPVIERNLKTSEVIPPRKIEKKRFRTLVGSSISSPPSIAITIVCEASGQPTPKISWTRNGAAVVSSRNIKVKDKILRIKSFSVKEIGRYECTAKNVFGVDKAVSNVNIKGKFDILFEQRLKYIVSIQMKKKELDASDGIEAQQR